MKSILVRAALAAALLWVILVTGMFFDYAGFADMEFFQRSCVAEGDE